eukprot:11786209-Alexandrium_andersonii.AAC.1
MVPRAGTSFKLKWVPLPIETQPTESTCQARRATARGGGGWPRLPAGSWRRGRLPAGAMANPRLPAGS